MKSIFTIVLLLLFYHVGFAEQGQANKNTQETHLSIFILDGNEGAFTQKRADLWTYYLQTVHPKDRVVTITVNPFNIDLTYEYAIQEEVQKKLNKEINNKTIIKSLTIGAHGTTSMIRKSSLQQFNLKGLGTIYHEGISKGLKVAFSPIRNKFAPDVKILYQSCQSMCGLKKPLMTRHQKFMEFLGVRNGTIYGSVINSYESDYLHFNQNRYQKILRNSFQRYHEFPSLVLISASMVTLMMAGFEAGQLISSSSGGSKLVLLSELVASGLMFSAFKNIIKDESKFSQLALDIHRDKNLSKLKIPYWAVNFRKLELKDGVIKRVSKIPNIYGPWWEQSDLKFCASVFR